MKLKKIIVGIAVNLVLASTVAHANIVFHSNVLSAKDLCDSLPGGWQGVGLVTAKVMGKHIACEYTGSAIVDTTSTPYVYDSDVSMNVISGPCPSAIQMMIPATCDPVSGNVTMKSTEADLSGSISSDGQSAYLTGTVTMSVMGRMVTADVEKMEIHKV